MPDNKKKSPTHFTPVFFAHIRALWESGQFSTVKDFVKYGKETFKKFPSERTIDNKVGREGWNKHKMDEVIEKKIVASYEDLFAAEGMGDQEVVRRICDGIRAPERTMLAIVKYAAANGGTIDDDTIKKMSAALNYDLRTAEGFLDQRHKLLGAYAPSKHKVTAKISDIGSISEEEAVAEHERIHKNFREAGLSRTT